MPTDLRKHIKLSLALEELVNNGWAIERRENAVLATKGDRYRFFEIRNIDVPTEALELDRKSLMDLLK